MGIRRDFLSARLDSQSGRTGSGGDRTANRWLAWVAQIGAPRAWALTLAARCSSRFEQRRGLAMLFARRATVVVSRLERGNQAVWRFTPHVRLAIHPFVHKALERVAPVYRLLSDRRRSNGQATAAHEESTGRFVRREAREESIGRFVRREVTASPVGTPSLAGRAAVVHAAGPSPNALPLERVVQRIAAEGVREIIDGSTRVVEPLAARESLQIAQRVTETGRRLEAPAARRDLSLRTARPMVVVPPTAADLVAHAPQAGVLDQRQRGTRGPGVDLDTGASPINIEQLTDQVVQAIDRRIVAHRERTGRLF
jgi:hypothetical protein